MAQLKLSDYKILYNNLKKENEYLKDVIENYDSIQRGKCCDCSESAVQDYSDLKIKCLAFDDDYFKGLSYEMIASLAKKSIRMTSDNNKLRELIEDIEENLDNSELGRRIQQLI